MIDITVTAHGPIDGRHIITFDVPDDPDQAHHIVNAITGHFTAIAEHQGQPAATVVPLVIFGNVHIHGQEQDTPPPDGDLAYDAWILLANGAYWDHTDPNRSKEWQNARDRWRDQWDTTRENE